MSNSPERMSDVIIVKGPPGSGKGYLSGHFIAENPLTQHVSAGELVRGIRSGTIESAYTPTVLANLEAKTYLPDEVFGDIVLEGMSKSPLPIELSLLDGFPHNVNDLDYVQEKLNESGRRILGAVCLEATLDTCVARMSYRGMRKGEDVRKSTIFAASESEREYYAERYAYYLDTRDALIDILMSRGLNLELIDTNPDILEEESRRGVLQQFTGSINNLREV